MNITAKDVGRWVVARSGKSHKIVGFDPDNTVRPVVIKEGTEHRLYWYPASGKWYSYDCESGMDLLRFADEPPAEPPEEIQLEADGNGYWRIASGYSPRPDLAGTTWRYSKPERVK